MLFINRAKARKETGLAYLGGVNISYKAKKNLTLNELTYILYLAPAKQSGFQVCPKATKHCIEACLHNSGRNRIDYKRNIITNARIKKTELFFKEREYFMNWLVAEILAYQQMAKDNGLTFSVRLNGTSDISPEIFSLNGVNILNIFPDVTFYDYTKVLNRTKLLKKYHNYDLTFSYSGLNWDECEIALKNNCRVAVVFEELPKKYKGIKVINGDETDIRHKDKKNVIVGLKFKSVRKKIDFKVNPFIVSKNDVNCEY